MFAATDGPLLGVNAWGDEDPEPTDEPEGFIDECDELAMPEEAQNVRWKLQLVGFHGWLAPASWQV